MLTSIEDAVRNGFTSAGWIALAVGLVAAGVGGFLGAYLRKKGEDFATREDFAEVLRQLKAQTEATERIKGEIAERITSSTEHLKADLSVWAGFRNDVLKEMWACHRAVVDAMTTLILHVQHAAVQGKLGELYPEVDSYRTGVHRCIDLLTPQSLELAQEFMEATYDIIEGRKQPNDANELKSVRNQFYAQMAVHFHLEEVLPWAVQKPKRPQKGRTP